jgi:hypothetical protein
MSDSTAQTATESTTGVPDAPFRVAGPVLATIENLGPLQDLPGFWEGTGFSIIARPDCTGGSKSGVFLQLNLLHETLEFRAIGSPVVNRGSIQGDISIYGVTYLHRVIDGTTSEALHIEPGMWLSIPATTDPVCDPSIARLFSIPHGNAVCTVGFSENVVFDKLPTIPPANTVPFTVGSQAPPPGTKNSIPEYDLSVETPYRTAPLPAGITQAMVDDPNVVVRNALVGQDLIKIIRLITSTSPDGGIGNIPYITSNANTLNVESVWAIETVQGSSGPFLQLQYSQTALLNFQGSSFPHVTVGTLIKAF